MLSSHLFSLDPVAEDRLLKLPDKMADRELRKAASEGGAQIIDLKRTLCPELRCRFWNDGVLLYSDAGHLTPNGSRFALGLQDPISNLY
jgi:hypothetical protein